MTNFKQVASGLIMAYSAMAASPGAAATVNRDLTGTKVKSAAATKKVSAAAPMAPNAKQMPRLFPQLKLPEFELVAYSPREKPVRPAEQDLDTFLELSLASGRSPGSFLAPAESESAGSMNPRIRASKSKRDPNGRIIGLEPNGSASGMYQFIDGEWDRVLNTYGKQMLNLVGVKDSDKDIKGNGIFKDTHFTDQQIVDVVRQHVGRDTTVGDIPRIRGSAELMALRANLKLMGAAKVVRDSESIENAKALGLSPTLSTIHERHIFGSNALSQAEKKGQGKISAATLFSEQVIGANPHLFTGTVSDTINTISNMTDARAAFLEKTYYGTIFHTDLAEKKRMENPRDYQDAQGRTAKVAPGLVIKHNTLVEYVQDRKAMHREMAAYESALKAAKTPQEVAAAEKLRNLDAVPQMEAFLKRTGYIKTDAKTGKLTTTLEGALAEFRSDAGLPPGRPGFYDRVTLGHIQQADQKLTHFAALQAQQAAPAQPAAKAGRTTPAQPEILPAPGALDLRYLQKEQSKLLTSKDRKLEIAAQIVDLKRELVKAGALTQPTQRVKVPYMDAKGKSRTRMEEQPREFDVKRDGNIDRALISAVTSAQESRGLKGNAVIDPLTRAELKKPAPDKMPHVMGIVPQASTSATTTKRVSMAPALGATGYQVQQLAALGRQLHPGETFPLASNWQAPLAQLQVGSAENGLRQSFLNQAKPSGGAFSAFPAYATVSAPTVDGVDLSGLPSLAEPVVTAAAALPLRPVHATKNTLG